MEIAETNHGLAIDLRIGLPYGVHARPAARIAQAARNFKSHIEIMSEYGEVDAKSMLDILSLALSYNASIRLLATGPDAKEALVKLYFLLTATED